MEDATAEHPKGPHLRLVPDSETYTRGRPCKHPTCITKLNIYNPGPYCLLHAQALEMAVLASAAVETTIGTQWSGEVARMAASAA